MKLTLNQAQPEVRSLPESGSRANFRSSVAAAVVIPGAGVLVVENRHTAALMARAERSAQRLVRKLACAEPVGNCRVYRCA